ncbi:MAG: Membrane protein [Candidatus Jettenia ecosi]|uniref:Membrane protein n=1 Tax=Candidatus Jettenia ecosi TaxID=2494326 RepID=A0A533QC14_9BACT|nr:MAG: Membrane protein [Candidatus Jettenia ecosi]
MNQTLIKYLPSFFRIRLEGRANLQNILANTGWLFIDKILRMGVGLFVGVWIARYLGPEQFGLYSYVIAFVSLFGAFATLGLDGIVVRDIVRYPSCKNEILGTAFILKLIGGIVTFLLIIGTIFFLHHHDDLIHWLAGIIAFGMIFQAFDTIDFWFQSQVQSKYTVYAKNAAFLLIALLKVVLIFIRAPLIAFAFAGLAEIILGAIGLTIAYKLHGYTPKTWWGNFSWAKKLLSDSWPLVLSGATIAIYMRIDQIMLGNMVGNEAVGTYSAAVRISELWYFIPTAIASSIYPTLIRAYHESEENFYHKLKIVMGYFFWGALLLSVIIASFSQGIIHVLFGDGYAEAAKILSIHIYSSIIVSMSIVFSQKYVIDGTVRVSLIGTIVGAISNIVLNLWFIKIYGPAGAAIATVISYLLPTIFLGIFVDKRILFAFVESIYYLLKKHKHV